MTINTEMFQKIYDQINQHPETHIQRLFESRGVDCGTQRCIAGWAVAFEHGLTGAGKSIYSIDTAEIYGPSRHLNDDETEHRYLSETAVAAAAILGLDDDQAYDLFYNTTNEQAVEICLAYATSGGEA